MSRKSVWLPIIALVIFFVLSWVALARTVEAQPPQATPIPCSENSRSGRSPTAPAPFSRFMVPPRGHVDWSDKAQDHTATVVDIQPVALSRLATDTSIAELVARVDGDRWHADVTTLAQFGAATPGGWGTRHTLSAGNLTARDWISATLASLGWQTSYHAFFMVGGMSYNVVGERIGDRYPDDIYIVGAHMDSTSPEAWTLAPGAEDNASGTAALLEIARVLQDQTPARTIRLIAFSGEEQGLLGSQAYADYLQDVSHELDNVKGVYIMDMIGYTSNPNSLHVVLGSRNPNTYPWMGDIRDHLVSMAATYTALQTYTSNSTCCSDHAPFLSRQVPAVLLIGAEYSNYPYYHTTNDLPSYVVPAEGREIVKMVVAALAEKAGVICIFADVNCSGLVDLNDIAELSSHWRLNPSEAGYEPYDLNYDGKINVVDILLAAVAATS